MIHAPDRRDAALRVLVIEDEALLALQIEQLLAEAGHEPVGHAMDSVEAVALARSARPDLALVDLHLRDGPTGAAVMRALTREHGVPGLFLTANRRLIPEDFAGALGVIPKPFGEIAFRQALRYVARRLRGGGNGGAAGARPVPPSLELAPAATWSLAAGCGAAVR